MDLVIWVCGALFKVRHFCDALELTASLAENRIPVLSDDTLFSGPVIQEGIRSGIRTRKSFLQKQS